MDPKLGFVLDLSKQSGIAGLWAFEGAGIAMLPKHTGGKTMEAVPLRLSFGARALAESH